MLTYIFPDPTIAAKLQAEYLASRPYQVLKDTKGLSGMTASEKAVSANYRFLDTGAWKAWPAAQQKEFWKAVEQQKIPIPLPEPRDLGKDFLGRDLATYTPLEYNLYEQRQRQLWGLREESRRFQDKARSKSKEGEDQIPVERQRRRKIGELQGKTMGRYEGDPIWDDVVPIPQEDGEGALAAIAYTDEYAEGTCHSVRPFT